MDDTSDRRAGPRAQTGRSRRRRASALSAALAGAALLAAACSGSSTRADTFIGGTHTEALAYTKCMRAHGITNFPAPDAQGNYNNAQITAIYQSYNSDAQMSDAHLQCASLLPNGGSGLGATQMQDSQQQNLRDAVKAARCMRAHGITNFPDPTASDQHFYGGVNWQPVISAILAGLNTRTPSYEAAFLACNGGRMAGGIIPPDFAPGQTPGNIGPPPVSGNGS